MALTTQFSKVFLICSLLVWSGLGQTASSDANQLPNLRNLANQADVTALVVRLRDMRPIAALNADQRLRPASVSKLFASAAALQQFGPHHRFTTRFASHGSLHKHSLNGHLSLIGGGDPSLDTDRLRALIARLQARGVRRVQGNLIIDEGRWGRITCSIKDRCEARNRTSNAYGAGLSAAGVNFGTVNATVYPGAASGQTPRVVLQPENLPGYRIDNQATTTAPGSQSRITSWRSYDGQHSTLHIRGSIAAGHRPYDLQRAAASSASETARVTAALLKEAGIKIQGRITTRSTSGNPGSTLAEIKSTTLGEQLIPLMAYSNNYMADALTLDIAAARSRNRPLKLPSASRLLSNFSRYANQKTYHSAQHGGARFTSGSGLSLENRTSARDLVGLLGYMYRQSDLFPAFYGSLTVPRYSPYRTLKHGNQDFMTRLAAKTGTLSEPVTVRSLAGYMRLKNGDLAAFAIIINGRQDQPNLTFRQTVTAYQHDLEALLSHY